MNLSIPPLLALIKASPANDVPLDWINIAVGAALLVLGRKLFWLFVGGMGFIAGSMLAADIFGAHAPLTILIIAVVFGIVGALLSVFLQKLAVGLAGFVAGLYVAVNLVNHSIFAVSSWAWLIVLLGGIAGAILVVLLFDWALIIISSMAGAMLVVQSISWPSAELSLVVFFVLTVFGTGVQFSLFRKRPAPVQD